MPVEIVETKDGYEEYLYRGYRLERTIAYDSYEESTPLEEDIEIVNKFLDPEYDSLLEAADAILRHYPNIQGVVLSVVVAPLSAPPAFVRISFGREESTSAAGWVTRPFYILTLESELALVKE